MEREAKRMPDSICYETRRGNVRNHGKLRLESDLDKTIEETENFSEVQKSKVFSEAKDNTGQKYQKSFGRVSERYWELGVFHWMLGAFQSSIQTTTNLKALDKET
jgi:hypothetical protein